MTYKVQLLPFKPHRVEGLTDRLLVSRYENNYGGAVQRLIFAPFTRCWSRIRREWEVNRTVATLAALDDSTLKDIGIHRSQIEGLVRERVYFGVEDRHR